MTMTTRVCQIDPSDGFAYYQFFYKEALLAEVVATKMADDAHGTGMEAGREYWLINGTEFVSDTEHRELSMEKVSYRDWKDVPTLPFKFTANDASFSCPVRVDRWTREHRSRKVHKLHDSDPGFIVNVRFDPIEERWEGHMIFFLVTKEHHVFEGMTEKESVPLSQKTYEYDFYCQLSLKSDFEHHNGRPRIATTRTR